MSDPNTELLQVELDVWHPDCWTTELNEETGAGVLGHGSMVTGEEASERCTIYGQSAQQVETAWSVADQSARIEHIHPLHPRPRQRAGDTAGIGRFVQDVVIEYDTTEGIGPGFAARGFLLDRSSRMTDGHERWPLLIATDRSTIDRKLESLRTEYDAAIDLRRLEAAERNRSDTCSPSVDHLTPRQREAFELARSRGYYEWPRGVSATDLAAELSVSKSTFLEHLRGAERQLLCGEQTEKRKHPTM
ncbi:helix-turn-helix domain-containing protein [Halocatena halophila]|uniref:helix-turn-helix domain-containing protein n=1 Tax=Halocatena halophila TaxID=2814576 RepID=UPI002ED67AC1